MKTFKDLREGEVFLFDKILYVKFTENDSNAIIGVAHGNGLIGKTVKFNGDEEVTEPLYQATFDGLVDAKD